MPPDTNVAPPPVAVTASVSDPVLDLDDIQGDILLGLQKKAEEFVFFSIQNTDDFKHRARLVVKYITTTRQVQQAEALVNINKKVGGPLLPIRGLNVGFTAAGIEKLTGATTDMDESFVGGAVAAAVGLNDPVDANGKLSTWLPEFTAGAIDGVLLVTGETESAAKAHADEILADLGASISTVQREMGKVRPDREDGHEHFGYSDGISQPGVRGLTKREHPLNDTTQGLPGQDLLWPGTFVFGYPAQVAADDQTAGPEQKMAFPWMRNGSYMVFRRLEQRVPEFHNSPRTKA